MSRSLHHKHRETLIKYLSDPDNEWPTRTVMSREVLGFKSGSQIYQHFKGYELDEIEAEALDIRRKRYSRHSAAADIALIERAKSGDPQALKLFYQRLEGWNPASKVESTVKVDGQLTLADVLNGES
jgi:hypothetical protein